LCLAVVLAVYLVLSWPLHLRLPTARLTTPREYDGGCGGARVRTTSGPTDVVQGCGVIVVAA
jgi:hypothetical protein